MAPMNTTKANEIREERIRIAPKREPKTQIHLVCHANKRLERSPCWWFGTIDGSAPWRKHQHLWRADGKRWRFRWRWRWEWWKLCCFLWRRKCVSCTTKKIKALEGVPNERRPIKQTQHDGESENESSRTRVGVAAPQGE